MFCNTLFADDSQIGAHNNGFVLDFIRGIIRKKYMIDIALIVYGKFSRRICKKVYDIETDSLRFSARWTTSVV